MNLSAKMNQALRACGAGAVWQPLRDRGHCWQVDTKIHKELRGEPRGAVYLCNVMVSTHKAMESRGLVEVTEGVRECPYAKAFGGEARTRVLLLSLTEAGKTAVEGMTPV